MIRHLLISSAFILASTVTFTASANAEDASANANGTVETVCDFGNPQPGGLILTSGGTALTSKNGGTPAKVDIDCNGNATISISPPQQTKGSTSEFTNITATATNTDLGLNVSSSSESTAPGTANIVANPDTGIKTIEVNLTANKGSKISSGEYEFTVTLTSTP